MPATPASFAALANSLPRRGIWAFSSSISLLPIRLAKPGRIAALTLAPLARESVTILDEQLANSPVTS